jgi:hypothetical protein
LCRYDSDGDPLDEKVIEERRAAKREAAAAALEASMVAPMTAEEEFAVSRGTLVLPVVPDYDLLVTHQRLSVPQAPGGPFTV